MTLSPSAPFASLSRIASAMRAAVPQLATFGGVGLIAFVVDVGGYNLLRATVMPDQVIWAKVVSVVAATGVAWLGHRYVTFRSTRRPTVAKELLLFLLANGGGLLIASACLFVSHYVLGFTSALADNIAGNLVGLVLGTLFRYFTYRFLVFRTPQEATS
ncbi:GtrA family protein [Microbacterium sp. GCS4]|uniref:GtrA family protein n=1 Tax=Microbacterium sp. GCS4 TaxID=1692239 RepID=UPI0009E245E9|nr:GtrA family protein [Microbacterium sp. GCS4]